MSSLQSHFLVPHGKPKYRTITFPKAVAGVVHERIVDKLAEEGWNGVTAVNLHLHVVIDEAGNEGLAEFINTTSKIRHIVACIQKKIRPIKFQRGVHVTLAGTGLDKITSNIISVDEANKFWMQPWDLDKFESFVDVSNHPDKDLVLQVVRDFPILQDLVTNARCAFLLVDTMNTTFYMQKNRLKKIVNVLVSAVADCYAGSNGLRALKKPSEKWIVARSVFQELDKATSQPGIPFFPEFKEPAELGLRPVAACVLDVNVESNNNVLTFVEGRGNYALSMSPALSIVMANLLNTEAEISWTGQGFESIVMLSELKRMVTKSPTISTHPDRLVFELLSPAPSSSTSFSFPLVDDTTVVLNGARASYADVIAPYRLVQAKFSTDDTIPAALNLKEELDKMGLTNSVDHLIQQHLTKTIYTMWSVPRSISEATRSEARYSMNKDTRMECYPMNTLNLCQDVDELQMIVGRLSPDESMKVALDEKKEMFVIEGNGMSESEILKEFEESRPVTAVFATNCKAFQLTTTGITISSSDVDIEGKLKAKTLPENVFLQNNVELRFVFF